jgi:N utilization substance protein A
VCNALAPAQISEVIIDETERSMEIIVEDDQLSLAIGKRGQNVRLAVKLTGWKIDIKSRSRVKELSRAAFKDLLAIPGVGSITAELLFNEEYFSAQDIAAVSVEDLANIAGIGEKKAQNIKKAVEEYLQKQSEEASSESATADDK